MKITILGFYPDINKFRQGFVDFKVDHAPDKWEIFRGVTYNVKDTKKWLSVGAVKREDKWLGKYEREPSIVPILKEALTVLDEYLRSQPIEKQFYTTEESLKDQSLFDMNE